MTEPQGSDRPGNKAVMEQLRNDRAWLASQGVELSQWGSARARRPVRRG